MGAYLCIASNDVPPAVSKRVSLSVHCKYREYDRVIMILIHGPVQMLTRFVRFSFLFSRSFRTSAQSVAGSSSRLRGSTSVPCRGFAGTRILLAQGRQITDEFRGRSTQIWNATRRVSKSYQYRYCADGQVNYNTLKPSWGVHDPCVRLRRL